MEPYLFNLDAPIENLSGVPSDLQQFFTKTNEGFVVADAFKPVATRMNGLATNLTETRAARTKAGQDAGKERERARQLAAIFEGVEGITEITPEAISTYIADLTAKAAAGGKGSKAAAEEIERVRKEMAAAHTKDLEKLKAEKDGLAGQITTLVKGAQISDALASHKIVGSGEVLKSYLDQRVKVMTDEATGQPYAAVVDDKGQVRYNGAGNPMKVTEYVASLKESDDFRPFFAAEKKAGTGTDPNGSRKVPAAQKQDGEERTPLSKISKGLAELRK